MKKDIILSNGTKVTFNTEDSSGYEEILSFYEPKLSTLVSSWTNIPYHDREDLLQICRIKLLEALNGFNPKKKVDFSTYVYTCCNRKIFQISAKYKSKKYSGFVSNDSYVHLNHKYDKLSTGQFLETNKDKCPLNKKVITAQMCAGCPYHVRYQTKMIEKGKNEGEKKHFTLCKYYKEVMTARGATNRSLDKFIGDNNANLLSFISCIKQDKGLREHEFKMDFDELKKYMRINSFTVITMLLDGFNQSEIMTKMNISNLKFNKILDSISKNKKVLEILYVK